MKTFLFAALFSLAALAQSPLSSAKTVFLLPMPGGLDQYLAVRLTQDSSLTVVTKADSADLIFTDQLSANLEKSLAEEAQTKDDGKGFARPSSRSFSRGKGTYFLVDRKTGNVVWSTIEQPKTSDPTDLNRAATHIIERLNKSRTAQH
ncbi:MAG: hypothetical protein RL328_2588 [Acidobacteriota bacterium]